MCDLGNQLEAVYDSSYFFKFCSSLHRGHSARKPIGKPHLCSVKPWLASRTLLREGVKQSPSKLHLSPSPLADAVMHHFYDNKRACLRACTTKIPIDLCHLSTHPRPVTLSSITSEQTSCRKRTTFETHPPKPAETRQNSVSRTTNA